MANAKTVPSVVDTTAPKTEAGRAAAGSDRLQPKAMENMEKMLKTAEEFVSFNQANVEAMLKSGQIFAAGFQDLSQQMAASAQATFSDTLSTFKALTGVKSFKEAMELQAGLARSTVEKTLSETGRLTEASFKIAEQGFAPIAARVSVTVEKFGRTA
jgi:phasin family protein